MSQCLGFLMTELTAPKWRQALLRFLLKIRSWVVILPASEVELFEAQTIEHIPSSSHVRPDGSIRRTLPKSRKVGACISANGTVYLVKTKQEGRKDLLTSGSGRRSFKLRRKESKKLVVNASLHRVPRRFSANGGSDVASLFTKRGLKGVNQDAMIVLENFTARADTVFCGVFDGHGPEGHLVARSVRDALPEKLASCWQSLHSLHKEPSLSSDTGFPSKGAGDPHTITAWKESFLNAYKLMDRELLVDEKVDCMSSGTTAVTLVKQGNDLFIGNVGDSRAILGMITDDNSMMALQLTIDLKPNLPKEAERIRRLKGRVFALRNEPLVKRVWLPHHNTPGLAMARALGDYCLKNFGVISEPVITYRRLTKKDKFIVLATDGVWDVLSNEQVIKIVATAPVKSLAAKAVVDAAVNVWKSRHSTSRIDDCAVVCLFLDECSIVHSDSIVTGGSEALQKSTSTEDMSIHLNGDRAMLDSSPAEDNLQLLTNLCQDLKDTALADEKKSKKRKLPAQPMNTEDEKEKLEGTRASKLVSIPKVAQECT